MGVRELETLRDIVLGANLARAVCRIGELGIADLFPREGSAPVAALATASGSHEEALYRTLRYLAAHGIFAEDPAAPRSFHLTPLAEALRRDSEHSFAAAVRVFEVAWAALDCFPHTLATGANALEAAVGEPLFEYLAAHPEIAMIFDAAMTSFHDPETPAMLTAYGFDGVRHVVDVGGGNGSMLLAVLGKHPELTGTVFDLDHVAVRTRQAVAAAGMTERCDVVAGDAFRAVPDHGDCYVLRHVLHDWADEPSAAILRNCRAAMGTGDRLLVVEAVVPEGNGPSVAKDWDVTMMLYTGGRERTEAEYRALLAAAGLRIERVVPTESMVSVIEARPS
ncbi:MAG: methyltransferase [Acidimicrobiia bacterium]